MANIVRRHFDNPLRSSAEELSLDVPPARIHRGAGICVESQLSLGVEPVLNLAWIVSPPVWAKGFTLMVFRSRTGFSPEKHPDDLSRHGELFIETKQNDSHIERPEEGTLYYTFLLHKKVLLGLAERMMVVRFSETIPSAKVGLGRIRDKIDLQAMLQRHELDQIEHQAKLNEAELRLIQSRRRLKDTNEPKERSVGDPVLAEEIAAVDAIVEGFIAKREKLESLKRSPKFKALKPKERKAVIETIQTRLDPAELSARRERK